jgi:hypothetical protein
LYIASTLQINERKQLCAEVLRVDLEEKAVIREGECEEVFHLVPTAWLSQWVLGERVTVKDKKDKTKSDIDDIDKGRGNLTTGVSGPPIDLTDSGVALGTGSPIQGDDNLSLSGGDEAPSEGDIGCRDGEVEKIVDMSEGKNAVGSDEVLECHQVTMLRACLGEEGQTVIFEDSIVYPVEEKVVKEGTGVEIEAEVVTVAVAEENGMKAGQRDEDDIETGRIDEADGEGRDEDSMTQLDVPENNDNDGELMSVDEAEEQTTLKEIEQQEDTEGEPFALSGDFPDYCPLPLLPEDDFSKSSDVTFLDPSVRRSFKEITSASMLGILDEVGVTGGGGVNGVADREGRKLFLGNEEAALDDTEDLRCIISNSADHGGSQSEDTLAAVKIGADMAVQEGGLNLDDVTGESGMSFASHTRELRHQIEEEAVKITAIETVHAALQEGTIVETQRDEDMLNSIDTQILVEGNTEQSSKAKEGLIVRSDSPKATPPAIFCDSITPYIRPLLCPHYPQTLCGVHPDNVTAFKVVSDRAYRLIMASVQGVAGVNEGEGGLRGTRTQVAAVLHASDANNAQSHSSGGGSSSSSSSGNHSSAHLADSTHTHTHPLHHADRCSPSPADLCTVIDITDKNYRCPLCFDQMIAKKDSLKVRAREVA